MPYSLLVNWSTSRNHPILCPSTCILNKLIENLAQLGTTIHTTYMYILQVVVVDNYNHACTQPNDKQGLGLRIKINKYY